MRSTIILSCVCATLLTACLGPREIKPHVFQLNEAPQMLTEALAVAKATEAFRQEGYKMEQWRLTRAYNPPSNAPDGTPDTYFVRFSFRPAEGRVSFTDGEQFRTLQIRLEGDRLVCSMFYGN